MRECLECGGPVTGRSVAGQPARFCCAACRKAWNNRRAVRGAELYDLAMQWRMARSADPEALTVLCNAIASYREADKRKRDGRKSWDENAAQRLPMRPFGDGR